MIAHEYMKDVVQTVYREMTFYLDTPHLEELQTWLVRLRTERRPQFLHADVVASSYWSDIEENDIIYDFVTRGTILFQTLIDAHKGPVSMMAWRQSLAGAIAHLYAPVKSNRGQRPIVSKTFTEKLPGNDYMNGLLNSETWLVFVLTLDLFMSHLVVGATDGNASA